MKTVRNLSITPSEKEQWISIAYLPFQFYLIPLGLGLIAPYFGLDNAEKNFLFYAINFVAMILIFHRYLGRCLSSFSRNFWESIQAGILGYVAFYACRWVLGYVFSLFGWQFQNLNDEGIMLMAGQKYGLMAFGVVVLVPVAEECLFRGLLFGGVYSKGRILAYCVSTVAFAAIHVMGYIGQVSWTTLLMCWIQYLPAGIWLAWSYEKSGNVIVPMAVHAVVNFVGIYALR